MQVLLLLIIKVNLKSGTFYFSLKYGCRCVTSTFTKVNIYLVICTFPPPLIKDHGSPRDARMR